MNLIKRPRCVALTAPRRMGKSMTLSTLHLIKLLGTQDFILLMDKKTDKIPGWDFTKKRLLEQPYRKQFNVNFYWEIPQPVAIMTPDLAKNEK